ncbi:hypothetical protein GGX14DRAFT_408621 [Mycena pura]|uniref:Uncharacterized protein n=1 Tax=Mycena pura TaxID=153505 RepID=A0AAD6Y384_9AGAR|nr:hypothetical protein GGX14DRAFT_408621 [Mycena pura]
MSRGMRIAEGVASVYRLLAINSAGIKSRELDQYRINRPVVFRWTCGNNGCPVILQASVWGHLYNINGKHCLSDYRNITYGIKVSTSEDPYIKIAAAEIAAEAKNGLAVATIPGAFLVPASPGHHTSLKLVPSWVPGAGFKCQAQQRRKVMLDTQNTVP